MAVKWPYIPDFKRGFGTAFQAKALQSGFKGALKPGFGPKALLNPVGWGAVVDLQTGLSQEVLRGSLYRFYWSVRENGGYYRALHVEKPAASCFCTT